MNAREAEIRKEIGAKLLPLGPGKHGIHHPKHVCFECERLQAAAREELLAELRQKVEALPHYYVGNDAFPLALEAAEVLALLSADSGVEEPQE